VASEGESSGTHVLRYIDWADNLILYDPRVAARAKEILNLVQSVSTWGDLRRLQATSPELVDQIIARLWDQWDSGDGAWEFGCDLDDPDVPTAKDMDAFLAAFPDEQPLTVEIVNGDGEPILMDPFDPVAMGVPEALHRYYVEHSTMVSSWFAPTIEDLDEIRRVAEDLGWTVGEGDLSEVPHF
jgi:hypothetical protein